MLVAVEHSYRYYQFYGNLAISLLLLLTTHVLESTTRWTWKTYTSLIALEVLLVIASRDCLARYYTRLRQLLGEVG